MLWTTGAHESVSLYDQMAIAVLVTTMGPTEQSARYWTLQGDITLVQGRRLAYAKTHA